MDGGRRRESEEVVELSIWLVWVWQMSMRLAADEIL